MNGCVEIIILPIKIECAKIKGHYESIVDPLLNHGNACNSILFVYKIPFSDICLKRPFIFHFVYRCSVQTLSPPLLDEELWGRVIWVILILKLSEALILIVEENDSFCVTF